MLNIETRDAQCRRWDTGPAVTFTSCLDLHNLSGEAVVGAQFVSFGSRTAYLDHTVHFDPPLGAGEVAPVCMQVEGAVPGEEFCFYVLLQHAAAGGANGQWNGCVTAGCLRVPPCPHGSTCDFNGDGLVNGADLGFLLAAWGACPQCAADVTGDGVVDGADLGLLLAAWS
ncbi:MAG: hypothetical protein JNK53_03230 [Phycisphaerae bacterium]|nr:hypothetical protein [Phycisphaerae bacterium]